MQVQLAYKMIRLVVAVPYPKASFFIKKTKNNDVTHELRIAWLLPIADTKFITAIVSGVKN